MKTPQMKYSHVENLSFDRRQRPSYDIIVGRNDTYVKNPFSKAADTKRPAVVNVVIITRYLVKSDFFGKSNVLEPVTDLKWIEANDGRFLKHHFVQ